MTAGQICGILDKDLVQFIHNIVVLLKIAVPLILVILGMIDFGKGVASSKEDEIKKGQQMFIKRLIAGFLVFFVVTIVQFIMGLVSSNDDSFWRCANSILNGTAGKDYTIEEPIYNNDDSNSNAGTSTDSTNDNGNANTNTNTNTNTDTNGDDSIVLTGVTCDPLYDNGAIKEYSACLKNYSDQICHTLLQQYCDSNNSDLLWRDSYGEVNEGFFSTIFGLISKKYNISCGTFSHDVNGAFRDNYIRQLAICFNNDDRTEEALQGCLNGPFAGICHK